MKLTWAEGHNMSNVQLTHSTTVDQASTDQAEDQRSVLMICAIGLFLSLALLLVAPDAAFRPQEFSQLQSP